MQSSEHRAARDEYIAMAVQVAGAKFSSDCDEYRSLLKDSQRGAAATAERPIRLKESGKAIPRKSREAAEAAVKDLWRQIDSDLDEVVRTFVAETPPGEASGRRYPIATEQLAAAVLTLAGPERIQGRIRDFVARCGHDGPTIAHALNFAEWRQRDPVSGTGRVLLPAAVAAFEELLASLVRLWLTLYPAAMRVGGQLFPVDEMVSYASVDDQRRMAIDHRV